MMESISQKVAKSVLFMNKAISSTVTIRMAEEMDLKAIREIYNYYVLNSTCTFDLIEQTAQARKVWWDEHCQSGLPIIVAETSKEVIGWGSLSYYHSRCAYKKTFEPSLYLAHHCIGKGLGKELMSGLVELAAKLGGHNLVVQICSENLASIKLVQEFGFEIVGTLQEVGRKFDRWLDVTIAQKVLNST